MRNESQTTAHRGLDGYYRQSGLWELSRFESSPQRRLRARVIASLIDPDVDSVLEVGCGNGSIARAGAHLANLGLGVNDTGAPGVSVAQVSCGRCGAGEYSDRCGRSRHSRAKTAGRVLGRD